MKKLPFLTLIKIVLSAATIIMLAIFAILVVNNNIRQKNAEAQLLSAIDNVVNVCNSYNQKINIDENLKADLDIYTQNIQTEESLMRKAYFARIMITYTQNRVNFNDPKTNYELAQELGTEYQTTSAEISAYANYSGELAQALEQFNTAYDNYFTNPDLKNKQTETTTY